MKPVAHWNQAAAEQKAFDDSFWNSFWTGAFSRPERIARAVTRRLLGKHLRKRQNTRVQA